MRSEAERRPAETRAESQLFALIAEPRWSTEVAGARFADHLCLADPTLAPADLADGPSPSSSVGASLLETDTTAVAGTRTEQPILAAHASKGRPSLVAPFTSSGVSMETATEKGTSSGFFPP